MRHYICNAATVLAVLVSSHGAEANKSSVAPGSDEVITLTFDWSKNLRSRVDYRFLMTQTSYGRRERVSVEMKYVQTATPVPKGLLIRSDVVNTKIAMPDSPGGGNPIRKFITRLTSQSPAYLVSNDGRFLRVHELPAFRKNIIGAMEDGLGAMVPPQAMTQLRNMISAMFTESTLHATASGEWDLYVGGWRNLRLKPGQRHEFAVSAPVPTLGNIKVPMRGSVVLKGRTACHEGDSHTGCVKLEMRVAAGETEMAAAMKAYLRKIAGQTQTKPIRKITQSRIVRIVCDPATLLPYASVSINESAMYGDGQAPTIATVKEERMTYSY